MCKSQKLDNVQCGSHQNKSDRRLLARVSAGIAFKIISNVVVKNYHLRSSSWFKEDEQLNQ